MSEVPLFASPVGTASERRENNLKGVKGCFLKAEAMIWLSGKLTFDDRLRVGPSLGGVPREQTMLKGHLPRVIHHQVYKYTKKTGSHSTAWYRASSETRGVALTFGVVSTFASEPRRRLVQECLAHTRTPTLGPYSRPMPRALWWS